MEMYYLQAMLSALCLWLCLAAPEPVWIGSAPEKTQRIVSLAPSLTELVFAMGAGNRIVGVTRFDNYPPEVSKLPKVGGFIDPNIEAVVELKPDLVLALPNSGGRSRVETMARLGKKWVPRE